MRQFRLLAALVLAIGVLVGFASPALADPGATTDDGTDLSGAPDGIPGGIFPVSVSRTLGADGGVLRGTVGAGLVTLTVPAGTFGSAVQVTVVQPTATAGPSGTSPVAAFGLRVAKDGRPVTGSFARSVTVVLTGSALTRANAAIYTPEGAATRHLPFHRTGATVTVTLAGPVDRVTVLAPAAGTPEAAASEPSTSLLGSVVRSASDGVTLRALLVSLGLLLVFAAVLMVGFRRRTKAKPVGAVRLPAIGRIRTEPIEDPTLALRPVREEQGPLHDETVALPAPRSAVPTFDWWGNKAEKSPAMARD